MVLKQIYPNKNNLVCLEIDRNSQKCPNFARLRAQWPGCPASPAGSAPGFLKKRDRKIHEQSLQKRPES